MSTDSLFRSAYYCRFSGGLSNGDVLMSRGQFDITSILFTGTAGVSPAERASARSNLVRCLLLALRARGPSEDVDLIFWRELSN